MINLNGDLAPLLSVYQHFLLSLPQRSNPMLRDVEALSVKDLEN